MGSSNSKESPAANTTQYVRQTNEIDLSERIRQELERKINFIEESLNQDASVPNLIAQLANIIQIEGSDKMACVNRIVDAMGKEWRNLMKQEGQITKVVGKKEMIKLKDIRLRYFLLLLKTKNVIVGLLEESEIQKENVLDCLQRVNIAKDKGDAHLSESDREIFDESITNLSSWIDHSELVAITKEWNDLCVELEVQKSKFQKLFEKYKKKSLWKKIAIVFGVVVGLATIIGLIIATSGAAAAIAAGAVPTVKAFGITFVTAHLVTASIALGVSTLIVGGGIAYGYYVKPSEMAEKIEKITNMLNDYIANGVKTQKKLNDMNGTNVRIKKRMKFDNKTCKKIGDSLEKIKKYLDDYIKEGTVVISGIDEACNEFITKKYS